MSPALIIPGAAGPGRAAHTPLSAGAGELVPMTDQHADVDARVVRATGDIAAAPELVFELIADPARQPEWDGNDNLTEAEPGQRVRAIGDVFVMRIRQRDGVRENHVVAFEQGRTIAWMPSEVGAPRPGHVWRWDLEPIEGGTRVTHTYDWTRLDDPGREQRARWTTPERLAASIDRLRQAAEARTSGTA